MRLHDIFETQLDEVSMSPGALQDFAKTTFAQAMTAGFEAELIIPNVQSSEEDDYESEPDYDMDERVSDNNDIFNFFVGDYNSRRTVERAVERIDEEFFEYADEKARDEFENEIEDQVREVLKDENPDMSNEEIDEIVSDPDLEMYRNAQDTAWEKYREDIDYDMYVEKFFRQNYPFMSDIANNFNLDWPHWTEYGGGNGPGQNDINDVADSISAAIGMEVKGSSGYHSAKRGTNFFILEPDSSIDAEESEGEGGLELVSPPLPLNQCLEYLDKVFAWAEKYGCRTDRSTGFHMGISIPGQTMDNVDHLKFTLFLGDEYVLRQFGRESNTYAKSMIKKMRSQIQFQQDREGGENSVEQMLAVFKDGMNTVAANIMKKMIKTVSDRYVTVNIKANYIEVRSAGGDYLNDLDKIKLTLLRYVRAMGIAADPEAERQEYAKKMYKFLSPLIKGEEDIIQAFGRYSAGIISKDSLKSMVRMAQEKRVGKKTPKFSNEYAPGHYTVRFRREDSDISRSTTVKADSQQNAADIMQNTLGNFGVVDSVEMLLPASVTARPGEPRPAFSEPQDFRERNQQEFERQHANLQQGVGTYTIHFINSQNTPQASSRVANNSTEAFNNWSRISSTGSRFVRMDFEPAVAGSTVDRAAQRAAETPQARTYLVTYLPPNGGEAQIEIDANSREDAATQFRMQHPASYRLYQIQEL